MTVVEQAARRLRVKGRSANVEVLTLLWAEHGHRLEGRPHDECAELLEKWYAKMTEGMA